MDEKPELRLDNALRNAMDMPRRAGKAEFLRHLKGERLTRDEAIKAKCYECVGGEDSAPCTVSSCSLLQYCPWNRSRAGELTDEGRTKGAMWFIPLTGYTAPPSDVTAIICDPLNHT